MPTAHRSSLPQFSLKRLFATSTLMAVGISCYAIAFRGLHFGSFIGNADRVVVGAIGGILVGAAALCPFRMTTHGAILGVVLMWLRFANGLVVAGWAIVFAPVIVPVLIVSILVMAHFHNRLSERANTSEVPLNRPK